MGGRRGSLVGARAHLILRWYRERGGEPFTAREYAERFGVPVGSSRGEYGAHQFLKSMVRTRQLVLLGIEPKRYAPVLR